MASIFLSNTQLLLGRIKMKRLLKAFFAVLCVFIWIDVSWGSRSDRFLTTTLLPVEEKVIGDTGQPEAPPEPENKSYLWVQQKPGRLIELHFDLNGLPPDLRDFEECSLRVVAKDPKYIPLNNKGNTGGDTVALTGRLPDGKESIVAFNDIGSQSEMTVAVGAAPQLCDKIREKFSSPKGDRFFTITLQTGSDKAGALFYSSAENKKDPSNLPRLVLKYTQAPPLLPDTLSWSQHQQNPEHTGRTPWVPFRAPNGFSLARILLPKIGENAGSVVDYPLIYRGSMYLISKVLAQNYLLSLDFKGVERWRRDIGKGTVQRSPVISRSGILYLVTETQITGYDLLQAGKEYASCELTGARKLSAYTGLTQGEDGSLFLAMAENDSNFIYGFSPRLVPFLKAGPFGVGQQKISTITVTPDGSRIFAQTPKGAVVIDIADPSEQKSITLANAPDVPYEYYYVPVAGLADNIMIFSDFTGRANRGNIWGYSETQRIWNASGTLLSQPVLGSNGRVYYIQGGILKGHRYNETGTAKVLCGDGCNAEATAEIADGIVSRINIDNPGEGYRNPPLVTLADGEGSGAKATAEVANGVITKISVVDGGRGYGSPPAVRFNQLKTTSNLVMDGADNIYFWDNGYLHGYRPDGERLFDRLDLTKEGLEGQRHADPEKLSATLKAPRSNESSGPEQFIRLMVGPDGTLWANNKSGDSLYAFKPSFAEENPTLTQNDIQTNTVYRATGTLTVGSPDPKKILEVKSGTQIFLQAQQGIAFKKGFVVEKGAELLCRTGF